MSDMREARRALTILEDTLDQAEGERLELQLLQEVIADLRAVMSVAPEVPDTRLPDLVWERLRRGGTTHAHTENDEDPVAH